MRRLIAQVRQAALLIGSRRSRGPQQRYTSVDAALTAIRHLHVGGRQRSVRAAAEVLRHLGQAASRVDSLRLSEGANGDPAEPVTFTTNPNALP